MDKRAKVLAELIEKQGYSRRAFAEKAGIPATTLQSMLTRGVGRASVDTVIKVCKELGITVEEMERLASSDRSDEDIQTLAAHHDGEDWTEEELAEIERFKEFLRSKRKKQK